MYNRKQHAEAKKVKNFNFFKCIECGCGCRMRLKKTTEIYFPAAAAAACGRSMNQALLLCLVLFLWTPAGEEIFCFFVAALKDGVRLDVQQAMPERRIIEN